MAYSGIIIYTTRETVVTGRCRFNNGWKQGRREIVRTREVVRDGEGLAVLAQETKEKTKAVPTAEEEVDSKMLRVFRYAARRKNQCVKPVIIQ